MKSLKDILLEELNLFEEDNPEENKKSSKENKKDDKEEDKKDPVFVPYIAGYFGLDQKIEVKDILFKKKYLKYSLAATLDRDSGVGVPKKAGIGPFSFEMYDLMVHNNEFDTDKVLLKDAANSKYTYLELVDKCRKYWDENPEEFKYWKDFLK